MIPFSIIAMESERLSLLLKEIRGDSSIRAFCLANKIHRAAWQTWEAGESVPMTENLQKIAALKGWKIEELIAYLKTGDITKPAYTPEELLKYAKTLPFEERVDLARQLLAES